jgi:hypothetical protein
MNKKLKSAASGRTARPHCWRIVAGAVLVTTPFIIMAALAIQSHGLAYFLDFLCFLGFWGAVLLGPPVIGVWLLTSNAEAKPSA